jgi:2-polyprenyl-3-methyl-5-hydroxy-6-metoxy-1,4-benzoquinol methylase
MGEYNRGTNTKSHWEAKHSSQMYEINRDYKYDHLDEIHYLKVVNQTIAENHQAVNRKTVLDVGCAVGAALNLFQQTTPELEYYGCDFSQAGIDAASKKLPNIKFECRDILENPINEDYGFITFLETIEHIEEGTNYKMLDNILEHCEYAIVTTVDTEDDCGGEHISHYKIDTFDEKGYNVVWKAKLTPIQMPDGVYNYIGFVIKGKL